MTLAKGTSLGPYDVTGKVGEGGMGEVWRATDTRLGRQVALKLLPEDFAVDPERHARFEREAKVLASLNHPHIATLYGLEHLEVTASGHGPRATGHDVERAPRALHVLVMELVEGEDLAQRLARGPIPVDESMAIALQVASALEAAHEKGIVHRDLKPANVKVTPEGIVKVLDFGLAKAWEADSPNANPSLSPTITAHHTREGVILGTAAYMSPEQARGKQVDRRADIWAFGCLVYEMLTGAQTFAGDTVTDVIAAVVTRDPDWSALPAQVGPRTREVLRRCMEKDPRRRFRDIGDVRFELEESLHDAPAAATTAAVSTTAPAPQPTRPALLPWAVAAVALAAAATLAVVHFAAPKAHPRVVRAFIVPPPKLSFTFDAAIGGPVLSPDGTKVVFSATDVSGTRGLWIRRLDQLAVQPLEGTEDASFPFWSPDSVFVGFFVTGKLKKIDTRGGPPQTVCEAASGRGGAWNAEGVILFAPDTYSRLKRVPAAGGSPTAVTELDTKSKQTSQRWPEFLPDGRHFVYWAGNPSSTTQETNGLYLGSLDEKGSRFLLAADSDARYVPSGYLLFLRDRSLMAQPFDATARTTTGDAFPIAEEVSNPQSYRLGSFSASNDGTLVYQTGDTGKVRAIWVSAEGAELGTLGDPAAAVAVSVSPDGQRVAEEVQDPRTKNVDIWLQDIARNVKTRFTFDPAFDYYPVWSPDGRKIAFSSNRKGHFDIYVKDAGGAGEEQPLLVSDAEKYVTDWSSDGRYLTFTQLDSKSKNGADLYIMPLSDDRKPAPFLSTQFSEGMGQFSPDGHWLAYISDESGKAEIYVTTFPTASGKWQVSQNGGSEPRWRHDGAALRFRTNDGVLLEAAITAKEGTLQVGTPHEATRARLGEFDGRVWAYGTTPREDRFLILRPENTDATPLTLVTNWLEGTKR